MALRTRTNRGRMAAAEEIRENTSGENAAHVHRPRDIWITLIAMFKLIKGLLLLAVGIGALSLIHKDVAETLSRWVDVIRVDPENRHIHGLLSKMELFDARKLKEISAGTF